MECGKKFMSKVSQKILIIAGGTGGHVFPAICIFKRLANDYHVDFATDRRGLVYLEKSIKPVIVQDIDTSSRLKLYISLLINIAKSIVFTAKNKYDLVIGFGGYPSIPLVISYKLFKSRIIIHEQNAVIGKANKLLSKLAFKIITSFTNTKCIENCKKIIHIGNPTRFENVYDINTPRESDDEFAILVFGGSQGARVFSEDVADALCEVAKSRRIAVYHQCTRLEIEKTKKKYTDADVDHVVEPFFDNMSEMYKKSDIVIARSGASSIFEIIGFRKPAILIPYLKSINGDQMENAKFLQDNGAAILLKENEQLRDNVYKILMNFIDNKTKLDGLAKNLNKLYRPNVTELLVECLKNCLPH
jgi:UDP-N-acetylglucosamine--N-acetylmuramyl-(pentapeptide) pyrophosphoryl-undecaprenol N-acetylglucosamine transferase